MALLDLKGGEDLPLASWLSTKLLFMVVRSPVLSHVDFQFVLLKIHTKFGVCVCVCV